MANFCASCGAPVNPDHQYCESCGAPIVESPSVKTAAPSQGGTSDSAGQPTSDKSETAAGAAGFAAGTASAAFQESHDAHASYQPHQPYTASTASQSSASLEKSALSRAWDDFKAQPGLAGKLALLGLIEMVPILDFAAIGYTLKWGAGAARSKEKAFPSRYMGSFAMGFFAFVVALVWGIVIALLGNIPLVGWAADIFMLPMALICLMRLALFDSIGEGFAISKMWQLYRNHFGKCMGAYWIPALIEVAVVLVALIIAGIFGGLSVLGLMGMGSHGATALLAGGFSIFAFIVILICIYVCAVAGVATSLISNRALGYVIADHEPEWVQESMMANPVWED